MNDLARLLRIIADGREEYANAIPEDTPNPALRAQRDILLSEAHAFRSAAAIADGDTSGLWRLLPTWRLTPDVQQLADRVAGKTEPVVTDAMIDAAMAAVGSDNRTPWMHRTWVRLILQAGLRACEGRLS